MQTRCSGDQRETLIEYMEEHPELVAGKHTTTFTAKNSEMLWKEVSDLLNAMPGPTKDRTGWRETWKRIKRTSKDQRERINNSACATGGGLQTKTLLTPVQKRVLALLDKAITKNQNNPSENGTPDIPVLVLTLEGTQSQEHQESQDPLGCEYEKLEQPVAVTVELPVLQGPVYSTSIDEVAPTSAPLQTAPQVASASSLVRGVCARRRKLRAARARRLRATALAKKHQSIQEELLELRKSELEMAAEQYEKVNKHAAQLLIFQVEKQKAMAAQHAISNRHAEQQIAVQQRLANVFEQLVAKMVSK